MSLRHMFRKLLRAEPVLFCAPPIADGTLCRCGSPATEQWYPSVCALADEPKEWVPLCTECDIRLNEMTVRALYGEARDNLLAVYRADRTLSAADGIKP